MLHFINNIKCDNNKYAEIITGKGKFKCCELLANINSYFVNYNI